MMQGCNIIILYKVWLKRSYRESLSSRAETHDFLRSRVLCDLLVGLSESEGWLARLLAGCVWLGFGWLSPLLFRTNLGECIFLLKTGERCKPVSFWGNVLHFGWLVIKCVGFRCHASRTTSRPQGCQQPKKCDFLQEDYKNSTIDSEIEICILKRRTFQKHDVKPTTLAVSLTEDILWLRGWG